MPFPRLAAFIVGLALAGLGPAGTARAQAPAAPPNQAPEAAVPAPLQPGDVFGKEVDLPGRKVVYIVGRSAWDSAFDTLVDSYKSLKAYLDKQGLRPDGPAMTIYTETDDRGFSYQAAVPLAETPKEPPKGDIAMGQSPSGKMLKFVHRGSYDALDSTYEAITNYLDQKQLEAKDQFVEEYVSDILSIPPDNLVVNIYVPVK